MSELVLTEEGLDGLGAMLAGLVRGNLERDPRRASLLRGLAGRVNVRARDAGVHVGLVIAAGRLRVLGAPLPGADLSIETDADTLMQLSAVPLRYGLPDATTPDGRAVLQKMLRGELRVRGMWRRPGLLVRVQKLLSVS